MKDILERIIAELKVERERDGIFSNNLVEIGREHGLTVAINKLELELIFLPLDELNVERK